jgi:hypothetical protein
MLPNAFIGKPTQPTSRELAAALGPAQAVWDQLLTLMADDFQVADREWTSYSPKAGWSLRLQRKKRNIVYLAPCPGAFRVAFVLGDKALAAVRESKLPARVMKMLKEAKKYPEGTAVRLEGADAEDLETIRKLAKAKIEH